MNAKTAGRLAIQARTAIAARDAAIVAWYASDLKPSIRAISLATDIPYSTVRDILNRTKEQS